ncbi:MAG: DUF2235 domain-containing protein [Alphaproteobacteria bacterium]
MPRNIVVLSDGTGNAASSIWRTNVWRIFQSIDLANSSQVAHYDDGVGTSSFKPLAILGGGFGWGLKRNVIDLYKFICRNYKPGDKLFGFGFSRGAFTIRVLVGLIAHEGLVPFTSQDDLDSKAIAAYRNFRKARYATTAGALFRPIRDLFVLAKNLVLRRERYDSTKNSNDVTITFLGLWDTVAAYGLPVDEWTIGIDRYLWPLELPNRRPWSKIEKACHALSLDDERTTFHPVLWDESSSAPGKITQVWFAGVHANVGGGYPDDSLAGVPLQWIMTEAQAAGLVFKVTPQQPDAMLVADSSRDKDGRLYDSRQGLASYYRYGPREVRVLCNDAYHDVRTPIRIHHTVFERMQSGATAYAPIGLPQTYQVVLENGSILPEESSPTETPTQAKQRFIQQQGVWNFVWWRRAFYFLTVAASIHLAAFPIFYGIENSREYITRIRVLPEALRVIGEFMPGFVSTWWIDSYAANPITFLVSVLCVALPILAGLRLETAIQDRMLAAWCGASPEQNWLTRALDSVEVFRTTAWYQGALRILKYNIAPLFFAVLTVYIVVAFVSHFSFYLEDAAGLTCQQLSHATHLRSSHRTPELTFTPTSECWSSGVILSRGVRYVISLKISNDWGDGTYRADVGGYGIKALPTFWDRARMIAEIPLRRIILRPWFRIIARVGETGTDEYFLDPDPGETKSIEIPFVPHRDGELYLYVNDAVLPVFMEFFYRNNKGSATVTVVQRDKH